MKTLLNIPIILAILFSINSFSQDVPFLNNDLVNTSHYYYPNNGQVADYDGFLHSEVLFHSEFTSPKYYFQENKISFVSMIIDSINPDTVFRIDMEFYHPGSITESGVNLVAQDTGVNKMNYYLPHCANGIEKVPSYQRLIYQNAYNNIDVEITSNASGMKARFIIQPGGDPNDILLKFTGQDSVLPQISGDLKLYLNQWDMDFRQAYAYQINANNQPYLVSWLPLWIHNGNGMVSVSTSTYDSSEPLIIEMAGPGSVGASPSAVPPYWCTYYGGIGTEENTDFIIGLSGELLTVSNVKGSGNTFPPLAGVWYVDSTVSNVLVSKFDANDIQKFATYFGDDGDEHANAIAFDHAHAAFYDIYVVGSTSSNNLPNGTSSSNFNQGNQSGIDGFIARFDINFGNLKWSTFFGGNGDDFITDIKIDKYRHEMYLSGYTTSNSSAYNCSGSTNSFPLCNMTLSGYSQVNNGGNKDAFIAQLNTQNLDLIWCTYFGGDEEDKAYAIEFNPVYNASNIHIGNELYIVGETSTSNVASAFGSPVQASSLTNGEFPLANPGGSSYFQSQIGSDNTSTFSDAFIVKFNTQRETVWSTFFGGHYYEKFTDMCKNSNGIFGVGSTYSTTSTSGSCSVNNLGKVPNCSSILNGYTQADHSLNNGLFNLNEDILITQFSFSGELKWATNYGEAGQDAYLKVSCATDILDNVYVIANSFPDNIGINPPVNILTKNFVGQYYQNDNMHITENGYGTDNILMMFNSNYERIWVTYFGGGCNGCTNHNGDEYVKTITTNGSQWLYFGGQTYGAELDVEPSPAATNSYFDGALSIPQNSGLAQDGYITKLYIANIATFLEELTQNGKIEYVKGYPNPTTDVVHILLPNKESVSATINVFNSSGQQVQSFETISRSGEITINVEAFNTGLYFVKIITNTSNYVYSFVKQ